MEWTDGKLSYEKTSLLRGASNGESSELPFLDT